uniref:growth hormone secretagogue receptor type 1-like n=1 Tax=Styela clava TaxID=7725 RepID=UPI00193AB2A0|nr:growth hormone secretagogue receptor type 1-like [Styela clava]
MVSGDFPSTLANVTSRNFSTSTIEPYERPFGDFAIWLSACIIFTFLIIGFILNLLTILVIYKYPKVRNLFVYFIFSLCISDLISAVISPLFWYRRTLGFDVWAIPGFFCKFFWAADIATSFATAMHIMTFGFLRYFSIKFPILYYRITDRNAIIGIIAIWFISISCGFIPFFIFFGARVRDRYSDSEDARWPACTINMEWYEQYTLFQKIAYPLFLYGPLVMVVLVSVMISFQVYATTQTRAAKSANETASVKRKKKDKQAVGQLILIVLSFLIGYIPFTVYEFWSVQSHPNTRYYKVLDYWMGLSEYFFIRFSECLNPIFYNLGSSKMRNCTKTYLEETFGNTEIKRRRSITAPISSRSRNNSVT